MSKNVFSQIGRAHTTGRTAFNLSYERKFTCDMGELIPVLCDEVVPGDFWEYGNQAVIRFQPLVAPVLHEVKMKVDYFFVPYRLLWPKQYIEVGEEFELDPGWVTFITGGQDGLDATPIPTWVPTTTGEGSLWDYLGFPDVDPNGAYPIDFPRRAYNMVFNEYFRDQDLVTEVALSNEGILNCAWEKDYFTTALEDLQRGTAPAIPISIVGTGNATWDAGFFNSGATPGGDIGIATAGLDQKWYGGTANGAANIKSVLDGNTIDGTSFTATSFDINDLRRVTQIQRWLERNERAGVRYTEFLQAHFGVSPRDERLQRAEYIGGTRTPVIFSEVLQTSETNVTAQGNLAGHGIAVSHAMAGKYFFPEYGLILGLMRVQPRTQYSQGINRQWLKETRYDFFQSEFVNLSEQPVITAEICATNNSVVNTTLFGYQGRYNELRYKTNLVCGEMRTTFNYWHLAREFNPLAVPVLDGTFVTCTPRKDIFADQEDDGLIVAFGNIIKAVRPIPYTAEPGLLDHV